MTRRRLALFPRHNATRRIAKYAAAGNVLDVGSGGAGHLMQLPDRFVPFGVEISTAAVEAGRPAIQARGGELVNKDALSGM